MAEVSLEFVVFGLIQVFSGKTIKNIFLSQYHFKREIDENVWYSNLYLVVDTLFS